MRPLFLAWALSCTACTVDVVVEGRRCPCADGYQCVEGVCISPGNCAINIDAFRATWATPHTIRWEWEPLGVLEDFQEYRLITGPSEEDVQNRSSLSRTWTSVDNPELGEFALVRTRNVDTLKHTITGGLELDTLYHAQLEVVDTAGCVAFSPNIAGERTTTATPRVPILGDEAIGSAPELEHVSTGCYADSTGCWQGTIDCAGAASCHANLHRYTLDVPVSVSPGEFSTAYLAFQYRADLQIQPWWENVILTFAGTHWIVEPLILRVQSEYQLVELPLSAFTLAQSPSPTPLTAADISGPLETFTIGVGDAPSGTFVWIDEVHIGW